MVQGDMLADLPAFVATVEAGGFAAAAVKLNLTRSAVSRTVARLERRLGVRLFHRTTRSLALTEDGQVFFEHCRHALNEVQAAKAMLDSGRREVAGRLRVSMSVLFGRRCVAPVLIALADAHPKLELDLNFNDRLVDVVEDGFDLVVRNGPLQNWPALAGRCVAHQHMRVCASPGYLEAHGTPNALTDLAHHRAVLYGRPGHVHPWLFPRPEGPATEVVPPSRFRFDDLGTIRDAATDGYGLAWLPCWLIRDDVASKRLMTVLDQVPSHVFDSHALWPQTTHLPLRVRIAIDALAAALPEATTLRPLRPFAPARPSAGRSGPRAHRAEPV